MKIKFCATLFALLLLTACATSPQKGLDAELTTYNYPFTVKFYQFEGQRQKLQMGYMDVPAKNEEKGIFVLFHGKNFPAAYFEDVINSLTGEGYRVIAIDQIGFGKSTKPEAYHYTFQTLALNSHNLLKSIGVTKFKLLGHSMGGMLATRYTLMFPNEVEKLFLVNPIGLEDWKTMTPYKSLDEFYLSELDKTPEKIKQYQLVYYYDNKWKPEYNKWLEINEGQVLHKDYPLVAWNSALTYDMLFTQPVVYEFQNIKTPTVLIIGQRDRTAPGKAWAPDEMKSKMGHYPTLGRKTQKLIKGSKLIELPGIGHMPFTEDYPLFWKHFKANL